MVSPTLMRFVPPLSPEVHPAVELNAMQGACQPVDTEITANNTEVTEETVGQIAAEVESGTQQAPTPASTAALSFNLGADRVTEQASTAAVNFVATSSPVNWRPAEEVLPNLTEEGLVRPCNNVYVRRHRGQEQHPTPLCEAPPLPEQASPMLGSTPQQAAFLDKITKPLSTALPAPATKRRRRQISVVSAPPRRSRRVAKLPPDFNNPAAAALCRKLGFTSSNSQPSSEAMKKNQEFFGKPLSRDHIKAMASMLGKEVPEEEALSATEFISVV